MRWLRIQFSTKILSPRRGCGRVGVASGPGIFSLEVGNYDKESGTEEDGFDKWFELFEERARIAIWSQEYRLHQLL